jgi:hypothetical protein
MGEAVHAPLGDFLVDSLNSKVVPHPGVHSSPLIIDDRQVNNVHPLCFMHTLPTLLQDEVLPNPLNLSKPCVLASTNSPIESVMLGTGLLSKSIIVAQLACSQRSEVATCTKDTVRRSDPALAWWQAQQKHSPCLWRMRQRQSTVSFVHCCKVGVRRCP